jgi:hypothetical protein
MSDFISEKDPIIVFNPKPNFHGKSPLIFAAQRNVDAVYREYLNFIDECEETGTFDQVKIIEKFKRCLEAERIKDDLYDRMVLSMEVPS